MFAAMKSGQPIPAAAPTPSYSEHNGDSGGGGGARRPQAKVFNIPEGTSEVRFFDFIGICLCTEKLKYLT